MCALDSYHHFYILNHSQFFLYSFTADTILIIHNIFSYKYSEGLTLGTLINDDEKEIRKQKRKNTKKDAKRYTKYTVLFPPKHEN